MKFSQSNYSPSAKQLGVVFAILAAVGFSSKAILVKMAFLLGITAIPLLTLRMLFSVPIFLIIALVEARKSEKISKIDLLKVIVLGFFGYYLASLFDFIGLQFISAGLERLILFLYPTFVVILSAIIFRRAIKAYQVGALILCYSGIAIVLFHENMGNNPHLFIGSVLVLASCLTYSGYLIGAGEMIRKLGGTRFTAYAMLVSCIISVCHYFYDHQFEELMGYEGKVYGLGLLMAAFATVLPVFCLAYAIKQIGPSNTAIIGSIGPVATIFLAAIFLNEDLTVIQLIGSTLVMMGVGSISRRSKKID